MDRQTFLLDFPERAVSWQKLLPYAVLLSVTLALYGSTVYFNFVWDDGYYIGKNYRVQGLSLDHLRAIWTQSFMGHFAPMHLTALAVLHAVFGMEPFGYHLGQVLLHAACVCLLYFALCKMESPRIAFVTSLLFAVYPPNIETVAWVSETKSTLAFLFFLLSLLFFLRLREHGGWREGVLCGGFLLLSLLSKVNTVVAPAIFLLWDYQQGEHLKKERLRSLAVFFLISVAFVGVHLASFYRPGQLARGAGYYGSLGVHLLNMPQLVWFYVRMILVPYPLSAYHMFRVYEAWHWVLAVAWIGLAGLLFLLSRRHRTAQFWGLWFLVFLAPVLQIFPFPIWVADRYLYIPAIGAFVLLSKGLFWTLDRIENRIERRLPAWGLEFATGAILLLLAWQTHAHLPVWQDNLTLWEATTQTCDTSPYCHASLSAAFFENGQTERGMREAIRAVELNESAQYLTQLGDAYTQYAHDYRQALIAYHLALPKAPVSIQAELLGKLARTYVLTGNFREARRALEAGLANNPRDSSLWVVKTFLEWGEENLPEARRSLDRALLLADRPPDVGVFLLVNWSNALDVGKLLAALQSAADQ